MEREIKEILETQKLILDKINKLLLNEGLKKKRSKHLDVTKAPYFSDFKDYLHIFEAVGNDFMTVTDIRDHLIEQYSVAGEELPAFTVQKLGRVLNALFPNRKTTKEVDGLRVKGYLLKKGYV